MENQNIEWKQSWRDEYLEWVCGFANAQGGVLEIGRDDKGVLVGLSDARLPVGITEKDLQNAHKSTPYNPLIANTFFRSGQIEAWGRGIKKIMDACVDDGLPVPEFRITPTEFMVCFYIRNNNKTIAERKIYTTNESGINSGINSGIKNGINETRQK